MKALFAWLIYLIPAVWAIALYVRRFKRRNLEHAEVLKASIEQGLMEPPSLHPIVDTKRCIGSSACVKACPEDALGIINNKAVLINAVNRSRTMSLVSGERVSGFTTSYASST